VRAGCPDVCAYSGNRNSIGVANACRFRFLHRNRVHAYDFDYEIPILFLSIPLVHQGVLPGIELEQKVLVAIIVGGRFLDYPGNRYAGRQFLQAGRIVHMIPQGSIAPSGCKL